MMKCSTNYYTTLTNYLCDELKSLLTSVTTSQVNADLSFK
jgi:hypothetical protein